MEDFQSLLVLCLSQDVPLEDQGVLLKNMIEAQGGSQPLPVPQPPLVLYCSGEDFQECRMEKGDGKYLFCYLSLAEFNYKTMDRPCCSV